MDDNVIFFCCCALTSQLSELYKRRGNELRAEELNYLHELSDCMYKMNEQLLLPSLKYDVVNMF